MREKGIKKQSKAEIEIFEGRRITEMSFKNHRPTCSWLIGVCLIRCVLLFLIVLGLGFFLNPEQGFCREGSAKDKNIVAKVNGKAITVEELEKPLAEQIYGLENEIFELKKKRLDELIGQQLLKEKAVRQVISVEELLEKEVYSKVPEVTDEQVEKFYEQYKNRMVQRPEAELKQKAREILKKYTRVAAREKYIQSLRAKAKISIYLTAPKPPEGVTSSPE